MTESVAATRLSKVVKEFNVGINTVVEFLSKKGISIDSNPNTKIPHDAYELLVKEFQSEKSAKEESKNVGIGVARKETLSMEDSKPVREVREEVEKEELIIKTNSNFQVESETEIKKAPESKIKILGKMDVDDLNSKGKKAKPASEKEDLKKEESKTVEPKKIEAEKTVELKQETKDSKVETKENPTETEKPAVNQKAEKEDNFYEPEVDFESHIKVIGKIDLSAMNTKVKPAKKSKEEKDEERKAKKIEHSSKKPSSRKVIENPETETPEIIPSEDKAVEVPVNTTKEVERPVNFMKTETKKLDGPTILGRMDLPVKEDPKKSAANANDALRKKKKRKRIKKDNRPAENTVATDAAKTDKPALNSAGGTNPRFKDNKFRKPFAKPEVNQEDIQKQIKETLARLSGAGKSKASKHRRNKRELVGQQEREKIELDEESKKTIKVTEFVSANELAIMMDVQVTQIISTCMNLGIFVSINQRLDAETLSIVADEFGFKVEFVSVEVQEAIKEEEDKPEDLIFRAPIVTVMGHVDHGKTSLLDYIRKANVIAGEAGGITQHIGAYEVTLENGKNITFLDTPGHEAFTAMRARGAQVTDVAIIVVAADDNVMPQTIEAINHAQAAGVPIVFAINKIDKPGANPEKIKEELSKLNILVEDWGGKYQSQEISAKKGINVELLLEKVLLEAELLDLKGNPTKRASGTVIESQLDKGRGYISTVLIQNGTLKNGDIVLAGCCYGKVKAMYNERNVGVKDAGPSCPVLILGLNGAPQAGDMINVMDDEREVKSIATKRLQLQREQGLRTQKHITLDEIGRRIAIGDFKELNIIVKGDVDGSIEALTDSLLKLSYQEVQVNVIHKSVGQVTESDVLLASASNAIIIGFQVRPSLSARKLAEQEQIDIRLYSIIYNAINEIKSAIEGMLSPEIEEKITCNIEIREVFSVTKVGNVAGCMVLDGKVNRNTRIRLIRDGIVLYTGELGSLKRFKDDVKEVNSGYECGLNIHNFNDIKVGDVIEGYEEVEIKRKIK
ncbi:MAG: translation initiation factor IF-2 [Bacteroidetes bacterium]|nr:translation initiation factor IF-2 [Bacteroidota bacterium]